MKNRVVATVAVLLGVFLVANGSYMLLGPESWYWAVPGVPDRGPFNQHFVRDIGIIYALCGGGLVVGAFRPRERAVCWLFSLAWLAGHALFHFWEVLVGICGPESLLEDFGGVTLPALIVIVLLIVTRNESQTT